MADAGQVAGDLPHGDRPALRRKAGDVALDWSVQIEPALVDEQAESD
jgi:hypothetical protein